MLEIRARWLRYLVYIVSIDIDKRIFYRDRIRCLLYLEHLFAYFKKQRRLNHHSLRHAGERFAIDVRKL